MKHIAELESNRLHISCNCNRNLLLSKVCNCDLITFVPPVNNVYCINYNYFNGNRSHNYNRNVIETRLL